jgi:hypothetical protein
MRAKTFLRQYERALNEAETPDLYVMLIARSGTRYTGRLAQLDRDEVLILFEARVGHEAVSGGELVIDLEAVEAVTLWGVP